MMSTNTFVHRLGKTSGIGRLILVAVVVVGVAIGLILVPGDRSEPLAFGVLVVLAALGVLALFSAAVGLIRLSVHAPQGTASTSFLDAVDDAVLIADRDGRLVCANQAYARLTGAESETEVRPVEIAFADSASVANAAFRLARSARNGHSAEEVVEIARPTFADGGDRALGHRYRIRATPLSDGASVAWVIAGLDPDRSDPRESPRNSRTPIHSPDQALTASNKPAGPSRISVANRGPDDAPSAEADFGRIFDNAPIAMAAVDRHGHIGRTNAAFLDLFGSAPDTGEAKVRLADLVAASDRDGIVAGLHAAIDAAGPVSPIDAATGDGEGRSVRFYIHAIDGDDEAAVVNAIDITAQRFLESQFAQSQKMETVGQLAGGVAHDFNNVLTAIIGFSDLLLANHRPSDPSFQDIMNIKQNANRAAGLVRQLLAFSRRQTLRPQALAIGDLLSDLSILLTRLLGESVKLRLNHGRDLWPVMADVNQLEQVIINLAVNARDAMPDGGSMTIGTRNLPASDVAAFGYRPLPLADYVLVEVEDTGTGMAPEVQARVFEPFFSTKEVGKGTGLGLSTVYGIIKQTGAYIYFNSAVGKGTVFRIFLPRHVLAEGERVAGEGESAADIADLTGTATILLVEDEEAVRAFAGRALSSRGYQVHEAASGIEALEVMEAVGGRVDLVVSDVVMPELDGPSLLKELRKTRPSLKFIFVSGYAEDAFKKNLPEGETFQFLPKPFSLKQLAVAVKEILGR